MRVIQVISIQFTKKYVAAKKENYTHSLKFQEHTSECLVDILLNSSYMTQRLLALKRRRKENETKKPIVFVNEVTISKCTAMATELD